ncbi:hypothetical protein GOB57_21675 [Sinorhizobium meliloti]|nr:hypothetical protein [Sinorhizobium meliloti]
MTRNPGTIPDAIQDMVITTLNELPDGAIAWRTVSDAISKERLIGEVRASSVLGQQFCSELLRVSRDLIARKAADEARFEPVTASSPDVPSLEWLQTLKVLIWEGEGGMIADEFVPLLSDEDIADYRKEGTNPTLEEVIDSSEITGDRVLEVRTADGELVYNGRRAFEAEQRAFKNDWKP